MSDVKVSEDAMFRAVELLAEANARAERAEAEAAAKDARIAELEESVTVLREATTILCDAIADTELHGDDAHDGDCSICSAHASARAALAKATDHSTEETYGARIASLEKSVTVLRAERNAAFKLLEPRQVWDIRLALAQATDQPTTAEP